MCGRYLALTEKEIIEIRSILHGISLRLVKDDIDNYSLRVAGEVRPTDFAPIISKSKEGVSFENAKFGFKHWDGNKPIINARSETISVKNMFSKLLVAGRCVIPAKEYYEWKEKTEENEASGIKRKRKPQKVKHFIKDNDGNLLFFAGLYQEGKDGREFVIITKDSVGDVAVVHDRMPVILKTDQLESWLNGSLTPDDITQMDFNANVAPCEDEPKSDSIQLSLF